MGEPMSDDKIFEKYARAQTSGTKPTFVRDVFRHLLARLDAAEARAAASERERDELRAAAQWQPIETAPKDGCRVMLSAPAWTAAHCGIFDGSTWTVGYNMPPFLHPPTHWQPMPAPHSPPTIARPL